MRGQLKTVTVKREGDRWFICASSVIEIKDPAPVNDLAVGVDFGIAKTFALSTGEELPFDRTTLIIERQIKKARRRLSRAKRGSERRLKTKQRLARLTRHQADRRRHALHRVTTDLSRRFGMVCVEDLKIQIMAKSAKGTAETPGKNVKVKSGLNRELLEGSPFEFRRQLGYKLEASGGLLIAVDPAYTSQTCPVCGVIDAASRKRQDLFECTGCGYSDNADFNAATNIVKLGLATAVGRRSAGSESHWRLSPRNSPVSPLRAGSIPQFSTAECRESLTSSAGCPDPSEDAPELRGDHSGGEAGHGVGHDEDAPELRGDHSGLPVPTPRN